ncbi:hypothetical protein ZWY2020_052455 [Hordeum vulgare]|nr:hypothetical protein ZWY2020_052455 [Hordeum vulgare]
MVETARRHPCVIKASRFGCGDHGVTSAPSSSELSSALATDAVAAASAPQSSAELRKFYEGCGRGRRSLWHVELGGANGLLKCFLDIIGRETCCSGSNSLGCHVVRESLGPDFDKLIEDRGCSISKFNWLEGDLIAEKVDGAEADKELAHTCGFKGDATSPMSRAGDANTDVAGVFENNRVDERRRVVNRSAKVSESEVSHVIDQAWWGDDEGSGV